MNLSGKSPSYSSPAPPLAWEGRREETFCTIIFLRRLLQRRQWNLMWKREGGGISFLPFSLQGEEKESYLTEEEEEEEAGNRPSSRFPLFLPRRLFPSRSRKKGKIIRRRHLTNPKPNLFLSHTGLCSEQQRVRK